MINTDRIVPVTKIDLLSLYAFILAQAGNELNVIYPATSEGDFAPTGGGTFVLNQPARKITVTSGTGTYYFVGAYDYEGFFNGDGEPLTVDSDSDRVIKDAATLYAANVSDGTVLISNVMTMAADFT